MPVSRMLTYSEFWSMFSSLVSRTTMNGPAEKRDQKEEKTLAQLHVNKLNETTGTCGGFVSNLCTAERLVDSEA